MVKYRSKEKDMSRVENIKDKNLRSFYGAGVIVGSTLLMPGCARVTELPPTLLPDQTAEYSIPTDVITKTPLPTPEPAFTPTPDFEKINKEMFETALVGEELQLENVTVNRVMVVNWRIGEGIYAVVSDPDGNTRAIIQNFDCQFMDLRELDLLGKQDDPMFNPLFPVRSWKPNVSFAKLNVVKDTDISDGIGLYTSESYEIDGITNACKKDPLARPHIEGAETFARNARDFLLQKIEELKDK